MWIRDFPPIEGPLPFAPDPVIEAYKRDVDRTLIRQNFERSVEERLRNLMAVQRFAAKWRGAAWRGAIEAGASKATRT